MDEKVEIEMTEEALKTIESVMPPETQNPQQEETFIMDQNGKVQCRACNLILATKELFDDHYIKMHAIDPPKPPQDATEEKPKDPNRNEKGQFIEGNKAAEGLENSGRPCMFCQKPVEILNKITLYSNWTVGKVDKKYHVPFIEELCDEDYLDIHTDTLHDWTHGEHAETNHSELIQTVKKLVMRQKKLLLQRTLVNAQVSGAIFQLKANHGMIETEKRMLVGGAEGDSPIREYREVEERKIPDGE